ncbi:zinc finger Ran-binding domain-containing protein [Undibacterium sp. Tian12W]|uniref:zinc finger Ran-binding domain-containing protein n=1 Tax=Undibacterium sp. Tian12W TaxID=3413054 RepID=UPI003BF03411
MMKKQLDYDWVCHACTTENGKSLTRCQACGCAAFASVNEMEVHAKGQRKIDLQISRELAMTVLFWSFIGGVVFFFKLAA